MLEGSLLFGAVVLPDPTRGPRLLWITALGVVLFLIALRFFLRRWRKNTVQDEQCRVQSQPLNGPGQEDSGEAAR